MATNYSEIKKNLLQEVETSKKISQLNEILKTYSWVFPGPYMQVFKIDGLLAKHAQGLLAQQYVDDYFINEFYDLNDTVCWIDGFFKRSQYIEPFNYYIEYSLILFFQQDYGAAINLLIPAIEGVITKYLTSTKGIDLSASDRYVKIKKVINLLKEEQIDRIEREYQEDKNLNYQQKEHLLKLERKYMDNWYCVMHDFLNERLFAKSSSASGLEEINRHSIVHQLNHQIYHKKVNYIKLFNSLKFMCWHFLQQESKSILNEIDDETFLTKSLEYEEILKKGEEVLVNKHSILKHYSLHYKEDYQKRIKYRNILSGC